MEQPCKGTTREQLLELYSQRVFYYVSASKSDRNMKPCILDREGAWHPTTPYIVFFNEDMQLEPFRHCARWEDLYDGWEEANKLIKHIDRLYTKGFWQKPFVSVDILEKFKGEMVRIEKLINEGLKDYPNFLGIDFCDVGANGIQVRGHHKEITTHIYGNQTIKYDFTNKNEVINDFIEMWKESDTPDEVRSYKDFIDFGNKYGWD